MNTLCQRKIVAHTIVHCWRINIVFYCEQRAFENCKIMIYLKCIFGILFILSVVLGNCSATLDLSNLNVNDFQFFRYQQTLPNGELRQVKPPPPSFESHIQHAKAVGKFVQRLLFGYTGDDGKTIPMVFPPTVDHLRERFERRYGYRGQYLVEQLGNGYFRHSSGYTPCHTCRI
ncbi:uncharacterized protein LOC129575648 [Sitodiplosis mosellana]|uniref:uncharacterized protein LOC129575648 n=1 Tax=Sitodiplosis mosellana TaxID=263140 RepID=UPI002443DCF7|nr:uncharacterized protein LOC129575648 [Sitodiplosis mosellana]